MGLECMTPLSDLDSLACVYVYSDCILSKQIPPPLAARVCYTTGLYATAMSILWVGIYTLPQLDSLVNIDPDVSTLSVTAMYALVTIANATHSWNYYELVDRTGNASVLETYLWWWMLSNKYITGRHRYFARTTCNSGLYPQSFMVLQYRRSPM